MSASELLRLRKLKKNNSVSERKASCANDNEHHLRRNRVLIDAELYLSEEYKNLGMFSFPVLPKYGDIIDLKDMRVFVYQQAVTWIPSNESAVVFYPILNVKKMRD